MLNNAKIRYVLHNYSYITILYIHISHLMHSSHTHSLLFSPSLVLTHIYTPLFQTLFHIGILVHRILSMHPLLNFLNQSCMNMSFSHMVSVLVLPVTCLFIVIVLVIASVATYFLSPLAHIVPLLFMGSLLY